MCICMQYFQEEPIYECSKMSFLHCTIGIMWTGCSCLYQSLEWLLSPNQRKYQIHTPVMVNCVHTCLHLCKVEVRWCKAVMIGCLTPGNPNKFLGCSFSLFELKMKIDRVSVENAKSHFMFSSQNLEEAVSSGQDRHFKQEGY